MTEHREHERKTQRGDPAECARRTPVGGGLTARCHGRITGHAGPCTPAVTDVEKGAEALFAAFCAGVARS